MPRFYVRNSEGKWNILSTIIDEYIFDDFAEWDDFYFYILGQKTAEIADDLQSLKTEKPQLNVMSFEEAEKYIAERIKP